MSVGNNIKKRRLELRMSQQELADAMGYKTRSTIAKIESGENDVSQTKLMKFAVALDTTVEFLVSGYSTVPLQEPSLVSSDIKRNKNIAIMGWDYGNSVHKRRNCENRKQCRSQAF